MNMHMSQFSFARLLSDITRCYKANSFDTEVIFVFGLVS